MLLTLFVIAAIVLLGAWAFPTSSRAVAAPPAALALLVFGIGASAGAPALRGAIDRTATAEPAASERGFDTGAGASFGVDPAYLSWVAGQLPQDASYVLLCAADPCIEGARQWTISRLAPRTPFAKPVDAEWLVLSGVAPPSGVKGRLVHYDAERSLSVMQLDAVR